VVSGQKKFRARRAKFNCRHNDVKPPSAGNGQPATSNQQLTTDIEPMKTKTKNSKLKYGKVGARKTLVFQAFGSANLCLEFSLARKKKYFGCVVDFIKPRMVFAVKGELSNPLAAHRRYHRRLYGMGAEREIADSRTHQTGYNYPIANSDPTIDH
jgi:hypothetical protein